MKKSFSQLIVYQDVSHKSSLSNFAEIEEKFLANHYDPILITTQIYQFIKQILDEATKFGYEDNLWQCALTLYLLTNENSFTLTCERNQIQQGSIQSFVRHDLEIFHHYFHYDFTQLEKTFDLDCFSTITSYQSVAKRDKMYNHGIAEKVNALRVQLATSTPEQMVTILTNFYQQYGVGMLGLNKAFRLDPMQEEVHFLAINNITTTSLEELIGYEEQKQELIANTEAFIAGRPCNNVLLYGEAGTGKSTSIKAIIAKYYDQGLRMIEIYKHQFKDLSAIISLIKDRNYRFIIYMDDLSFEENETEYKFLKAVIEGGVEVRPENILIYATSNRRHLIKESWRDRGDMEIQEDMHISETMQEKLSLVARFGISIYYGKPTPKEYHTIVKELAARHPEITLSEQELWTLANRWELKHGGESGRCAQQLIDYLLSQATK